MTDFEDLDASRGHLFQTVHNAVNDAAFNLSERGSLNELLADPLAADHLLLAKAKVMAKPAIDIRNATAAMDAADAQMLTVLAGANSRDERRAAIDRVDGACDTFGKLMK